MKKSLTLLLSLAVLLLSGASALAGFPAGNNRLGLYTATTDVEAQQVLTTTDPFQSVTIYLVATGVTQTAGISGWECAFTIEGTATALGWTVTGGGTNFLNPPAFSVGIGEGALALPNVGGVIHLATATFFVQTITTPISFFLWPIDTPSIVGFPVYADGLDATTLIPFNWPHLPEGWGGGQEWGIFHINGPAQVSSEDQTWGSVKRLFDN